MKKKFNFITLLIIVFHSSLFSQKVGEVYLPLQTAQTPEFFNVFYQKNFLDELNVFELDEAAREYEEAFEKNYQPQLSSDDFLTGEEKEDIYILYYKRWRRSIDKYVQENGRIKRHEDSRENDDHTEEDLKASAANWSLVGPNETFWKIQDNASQPPASWQINIYSCAMAPSDHKVLYAGAETGAIYKTTDKGLNWKLILDEQVVYPAVAVHPGNPNIVYAGATNSVARSSDGGNTWAKASPSCGLVNCLAIKPSAPSTIFAACNNGLYKSTDAGATWQVISGLNTAVYDVFFKTNDDNTLFILKKNGASIQFLKSTDGGNTFNVSMSGWAPIDASGGRMTVTKADPNRLYAVILSSEPSVYRSDDAGASWVLKAKGVTGFGSATSLGYGQGFYDLDILANPNNADQLLVATTSVYKSTDGGANYNRIGGYGGNFNVHPDIQEMIALDNDAWIATDGGMNYSSDFFTSTSNFSSRNKGLFGSDFWGFAQGWNEDIVAGGRYHNGNTSMYENYPPGKALRMGGGEAPTGYYMLGRPRCVAFSDITDVRIPFAFNGNTTPFTFNKYPNEDGYGSDASEVEVLPYCYMELYLGKDKAFWRSKDGGVTWDSLYGFNDKVKKFEICRSNPKTIYLAATSAFYKSTNGGNSWTKLSLPSGASASRMEIAVDFVNENNLWITSPNNSSGNRVHKSVDGGASWINLTTPMINGKSYKNLVHQAGTNGGVYILTSDANVYYRNNTMSDWVSYSAGLPKNDPLLSKPFYRNGKLRTAGNRGIWETDFYEPSSPLAQPMVNKLSGVNCPADTFYFDSYSVLTENIGNYSYSWDFPGASFVSSKNARNPKVVYTPGTHQVTLTVTNPNGADTKTLGASIVITAGSNTPATATISQNGPVLTSSSATGNQWCLNSVPIPGAINQSYTPTINGIYTVIITKNGCASPASNAIKIQTVGIEELSDSHKLDVFPNPNNGDFTISFNSKERSTYLLEITNAIGEIIYKDEVKDFRGVYTKSFDVGKFGSGVYVLSLFSSQTRLIKKIVMY